MPSSIDPPLVAISIAPRGYSHHLIEETKEFVVNIPTIVKLKEALVCGRISGKDHDELEETSLTSVAAKKVKPPAIIECVAHLECVLHSKHVTGDRTIFVGEIVAAMQTNRFSLKSMISGKQNDFPSWRKRLRNSRTKSPCPEP